MIDCFLPLNFNEYQFHSKNILIIKKWNKNNFPNILMNGIKNSGKRTFIYNFIKYLYNVKEINKNIVKYELKINSNKVDIKIIQSIYHYEINLYECGLYAKNILCTFIKNIVETNCLLHKYKIIVLNNFEKINKQAQWSLRKYMELYISTCRFFIITDYKYMIDKSIISRCINITLAYPSKIEIKKYINYCSNKFNLNLSENRKEYILINCPNDLYKLNLMIKTTIKNINPLDTYIIKINDIIKKKNIDFLDDIRPILYKLHLLNYNNNQILKEYILYNLKIKFFKEDIIHKILEKASETSRNIVLSNKKFFAIESFFIFIRMIV